MGRNSPHYKREAWYHLPHSKPKDLERRFKGREPPCRRADRRQQATVPSQEKRHGQSRSFFTPHTLPKTAALPLPQPFHRHPCRHTPAHRKRAGACSGRPPFSDMSGLHSISIEQVHVQAETQQKCRDFSSPKPSTSGRSATDFLCKATAHRHAGINPCLKTWGFRPRTQR